MKFTVTNYKLSRPEILFPVAEKVFKKATADKKNLRINSVIFLTLFLEGGPP